MILCDKFRNERRGLGGTGSSPRVGKTAKMVKEDPQTPSSAPAVITEPTEEATVEIQTSREVYSVLQIRRGNRDNLWIISLFFHYTYIVTPH